MDCCIGITIVIIILLLYCLYNEPFTPPPVDRSSDNPNYNPRANDKRFRPSYSNEAGTFVSTINKPTPLPLPVNIKNRSEGGAFVDNTKFRVKPLGVKFGDRAVVTSIKDPRLPTPMPLPVNFGKRAYVPRPSEGKPLAPLPLPVNLGKRTYIAPMPISDGKDKPMPLPVQIASRSPYSRELPLIRKKKPVITFEPDMLLSKKPINEPINKYMQYNYSGEIVTPKTSYVDVESLIKNKRRRNRKTEGLTMPTKAGVERAEKRKHAYRRLGDRLFSQTKQTIVVDSTKPFVDKPKPYKVELSRTTWGWGQPYNTY